MIFLKAEFDIKCGNKQTSHNCTIFTFKDPPCSTIIHQHIIIYQMSRKIKMILWVHCMHFIVVAIGRVKELLTLKSLIN